MLSRRGWIGIGAACLVGALTIAFSGELLVRDPNPLIHVRWRQSLPAAERAALERQFHLEEAEQVDAATWRYELTDTSSTTVGALVRHAEVADTHYIDRTTFEIQDEAPLAVPRPGPLGRRWPRVAFALADHGPASLLMVAAVAALGAFRPHVLSAVSLRSLLSRGIPPLSPHGLAVFRIVFGLALALYVYAHPFPSQVVPPDLWRPDVSIGELALVRWLVEHPPAVRAGQWLAMSAAVLFAIGIVPRLMYVVVVAGIVQWLLAFSLQSDGHPFGVLLLPLLCLLPVPWGSGPPVWRLWTTRPPAPMHSDRRYGYAPWLLGFALGVAWAGAAWAKVREGPGWVLNGTVRYHFVSDASHAPVDWGLALATMPLVAILLSAGAVFIEAFTLPVAFLRMPMLRLAMGLAALSVLAGFYLFQGIFWPAWWLLLLGFVPWQWFDRDEAVGVGVRPRLSHVSRGQILCIAGLAVQQLVVSAAFVELPPVASRYDMYSKTHSSPEDYDRENPGIGRRLIAEDDTGLRTDVTECVSDLGEASWADLGAIDPAVPLPSTAPLKTCHAGGVPPERYLLLEDRCLFDWNAGRRYCVYRDKLIATLPVAN